MRKGAREGFKGSECVAPLPYLRRSSRRRCGPLGQLQRGARFSPENLTIPTTTAIATTGAAAAAAAVAAPSLTA